MNTPSQRIFSRPAFTLVEMLLVVVVTGISAAMIIPRVQSQRASAKRAVVESVSSDLAAAMELHYTSHGRYPLDGDRLATRINGAFQGALPGDAGNPDRLLGFAPEAPITAAYTYLGPRGYQLRVSSSDAEDFSCTLTAGTVGSSVSNPSVSTSTLCVLDESQIPVAQE